MAFRVGQHPNRRREQLRTRTGQSPGSAQTWPMLRFGMVHASALLVLTLACAKPVDSSTIEEFSSGQATQWLGMEPNGGWGRYNPALGGCTVVQSGAGQTWSATTTFDAEGRLLSGLIVEENGDDYPSDVEWDGACVVATYQGAPDAWTHQSACSCDDMAWPASCVVTGTDQDGAPSDARTYRYENEYDGTSLVRATTTEDATGESSVTDYAWDGNRVVVAGDMAYTWTAAGWVETATSEAEGTRDFHTYDDLDRLVDWAREGNAELGQTWTYDGEARWPMATRSVGTDETLLAYDCP